MTMPEQGGVSRLPNLAALYRGIESGELALTPDGLEQAAETCRRYIEAMKQLREDFDQENSVNGFGNLPSGRAVARHFTDKQREMVDVLSQYIEVATRIKAVFTDAALRYSVTHEDHVVALRTLEAGR